MYKKLVNISRGSYLSFLVSFTSISILFRSFKLVIITFLLFLLLITGFFSYQKVVAQPRGINRDQSAGFRFSTWQQGWDLFLTNPILGVGFNTYRFAMKQYGLGDEQFLNSHGATTNDSSLLYVAATTGIIGFISFIIFLFSLFAAGYKSILQKNMWGIILIGGLAGIIAQSFFANTLFYPFILLWLILISAKLSK